MPAQPDPNACPVCLCPIDGPISKVCVDQWQVNCPNCGVHRITDSVLASLVRQPPDPPTRTRLAHQVQKVVRDSLLTSYLIGDLLKRTELPSALERVDLLLAYLATEFEPGTSTPLHPYNLRARLGCSESANVRWVIAQAAALGYVTEVPKSGYALSVVGWQRHQELLRSGAGSMHAFMAMGFGDPQLWQVFQDHMQPAVAQTGFELRTVTGDHQTAGSIDNRMRVEIRTSRFLVCDLTHGNRGAYWEAGFAEGLGRPVIYVCRADVLFDPVHADRPHFDTRQQLIITWDPADPGPGMQALKNVIRATLPDVARLEDPPQQPSNGMDVR